MKVILSQDIENLGKKLDVKKVADGYARNFLIPNNLAKPATEATLKELATAKETLEKQAEEDLKVQEEVASQLDGQEIEMAVKCDDSGKIYGSITAVKIAKAIKDKGFDIKKNQIKLVEPIKEVGEYDDVLIEFPHGLEAKIKIIVTEEPKKEL